MGIGRRGVATSMVMVGMAWAGSAYLHAQPGTGAVTAGPAPTEAELALSGEQMELRAADMLARMEGQLQHGTQVQATARTEKDVIKLGCINQQLVEARQLTNLGQDAAATLRRAVRAGDRTAQVASYKRVAQVSIECQDATNGIDGCAGADTLSVTPTDVVVPRVIDDPTENCTNLGHANCLSALLKYDALEYVGWASPFTPN